MLQFTAAEINKIVGGSIEGNEHEVVGELSKIEEGKTGSVSFLANPAYETFLYTTKASVVIVNKNLKLKEPVTCTLIRVNDPYFAFSLLLEKYNTIKFNKKGIESPSFIGISSKYGNNVYIGAFVYIGDNTHIEDNTKIYPHTYIGNNVKIGSGTILMPGVKIYDNCIIGNNVTIHSGTVIGSDGFGFAPQEGGSYKKVSQIGNVIIKDDVEIGANCSIDRATIGSTIIQEGVKLDNLIQIAHNVDIGKNTVIAAQTGISGSTKIGEECMIAGQVGIVGHISVANRSKIGAQSGVSKSIKEENKKWFGSPAYNYNEVLKNYALIRKLPKLEQQIKDLQKIIDSLKPI